MFWEKEFKQGRKPFNYNKSAAAEAAYLFLVGEKLRMFTFKRDQSHTLVFRRVGNSSHSIWVFFGPTLCFHFSNRMVEFWIYSMNKLMETAENYKQLHLICSKAWTFGRGDFNCDFLSFFFFKSMFMWKITLAFTSQTLMRNWGNLMNNLNMYLPWMFNSCLFHVLYFHTNRFSCETPTHKTPRRKTATLMGPLN